MSFTSTPVRSRWTDVYIDSAARLLAQTGMFGATTALMLLAQSSGAGGLATAGLVIATTLPLVLLSPLTGRLADRVDSRTLLIAAGLIRSAAGLALAFTTDLPVVFALVIALSCGTAVLHPVLGALIPTMVTREDLPKASAIGQTASTLGMVLGPALAGLLVGGFGMAAAMYVNAGCALATVAAGLAIKTRRGGSAVRRTEAATQPWRLDADRIVWLVVIGMALVVGMVSAVNVVEVFFIRETLGASESVFGIVTGTWAAGMAVGAWVTSKPLRRISDDRRLLRIMFVTMGGMCVLLAAMAAVNGSAWWLAPLFLLGGAGNGAQNTMLAVLLGRRVPAAARGRAQATLQGWVHGLSLAGYVVAGVVLELVSPRVVIVAAGIGGLLIVLALLPLLKRFAPRTDHNLGDVPAVTSYGGVTSPA